MTEKKAQFIPFNAMNEFMLDEYRLKILQLAFNQMDRLSDERRSTLNRMVKNLVQVPGFRNSTQAPANLKARSAVKAFERSADFAAQVAQAWFELHPELAQKVFDLLTGRGWKLLPLEADRTRLPGMLTRWPKNDTFEELDEAYIQAYPNDEAHEYDINMMICWITGRLPVELVEQSEISEEN